MFRHALSNDILRSKVTFVVLKVKSHWQIIGFPFKSPGSPQWAHKGKILLIDTVSQSKMSKFDINFEKSVLWF